ncbi:hypothetical protein R69608_03543 [Paraburkholderia nemoris]|jgi:hypothetical protein|uniref:hypothetical protein n=1 Tax=Paraburkholderia nemoris TaxID=2793076 RepID=UPI001913F93B|nr:hypothetical protein [Paraburkholderia nemoris]MBK5148938.1 hypothetical protein [Burkholderia sp. R-69608]CAE6848163.1 hypothetical protein LMG22931_07574 [Paraburkholderia nemoris]CAE6911352.1 hypothetical protein R69608_03543 [Paraburkholderia nemoris]
MSRPLSVKEHALLKFLIEANEPLYGNRTNHWKTQVETCLVREIDSPYFLAVIHEESIEKAGCDSITLGYELVGVDHGVPVLIYAVAMKTHSDDFIDIFNVDRLDGEPLVNYPEAGAGLMIVDRNKRVGGADLRHLYGGSNS